MTEVQYDVSKVRCREPGKPHDWRNGADPSSDPDPGSFAARVEATQVDLVALVKEGIPPREYHAHSEGMLVRGKRHLLAAPHKSGKSLIVLTHAARLALAGEHVVIFDRENGADLYAERLAEIMAAWQLGGADRKKIQRCLRYYEFPRLKLTDAGDLVRHLVDDVGADVVVFDSQRMFLTDYGLAEGDSDDYARFMGYAIDPLHRAGISTLILDNTGHDGKRARGTSSKGDLNEVVFSLKEIQAFDRHSRGIVQLTIDYSRFGDRGSWRMAIGGGTFGEWESDAVLVLKLGAAKPEFKTIAYEELRKAGGRAMGLHKLLRRVRDREVEISNTAASKLLKKWAADDAEPLRHVENGYVCDQ